MPLALGADRREGWRCNPALVLGPSRYSNNAIENLVVAHECCNNRKRDLLAAAEHVARRGRFASEGRPALELVEVAADVR